MKTALFLSTCAFVVICFIIILVGIKLIFIDNYLDPSKAVIVAFLALIYFALVAKELNN